MDGKANSCTKVEEACLVRLKEVFTAELKAHFTLQKCSFPHFH